MSSNKDFSAFTLPWKRKPRHDLMTKLLFQGPMLVNLIVQSLLDIYVPLDSYTIASIKWADSHDPT